MKILTIDAGRYSLKWALFQLPQGEELASGIFESIGKKSSFRRFHWKTLNDTKRITITDHEKAVQALLAELVYFSVVDSLDEIDSIGHRVVAGGEYFRESTIVPKKKEAKVTKLGTYILLNNCIQIETMNIFQQLLSQKLNVAVFDHSICKKKHEEGYYPLRNIRSVNQRPFVHTLNNYLQDGRIIAEDVYEMIGEKVRV